MAGREGETETPRSRPRATCQALTLDGKAEGNGFNDVKSKESRQALETQNYMGQNSVRPV